MRKRPKNKSQWDMWKRRQATLDLIKILGLFVSGFSSHLSLAAAQHMTPSIIVLPGSHLALASYVTTFHY